MANYHPLVSFLVMVSTLVMSQQCDLQFDGRVPFDFTAADFNADNGVFDPQNVFGQGKENYSKLYGCRNLLVCIGLDPGSVVQIQDSLSSLVGNCAGF